MCDMTHSYVWQNSFICVTWLIHMCDMTRYICVTWLIIYVWHDSFTCVTWLIIHVLPRRRNGPVARHTYDWSGCQSMPVTSLRWISRWHVPVGWVWGMQYINGMRSAIYVWGRRQHTVARTAFICVTCLIHVCDMTQSYLWHDSCIRVMWLIDVRHTCKEREEWRRGKRWHTEAPTWCSARVAWWWTCHVCPL